MSEKAVFAVRSSSPEEDLENTSFAGQYETILGVVKDKIESAVLEAFTSMLDTRVVEYKKLNKLLLDNPKIAIIIQKQIASDVSGIAFSLNPSNNCYDEAMINASFGLGETIVSGRVTPDTYIVEKVKKQILDKKVMEKSISLWLKDDGGTVERENKEPKAQSLTDEQILMVAELTSKCEAHYGKPMDIEWAIEDGKLYLLQSRPITTYIPLFKELITKPGEKKNLYLDLIVMTQGFTDSLSVLGMDIWKLMFAGIGGFSMPDGMDGMTLHFHGREYFHVPNILSGFGKMGNKLIFNYDGSIKRTMDKMSLSEYMPEKKPPRVKKAKSNMFKFFLSLMPMMIRATISDYKKVKSEYLEATAKVKKQFMAEPDTKLSFAEAIEEYFNAYGVIVKQQGVTFVGINAERVLNKMFKGKGVEQYITAMGSKVNPTSLMGEHMGRLAQYDELQATKTSDEFVSRIQSRDYSQAFLDDYNAYMHTYGTRGYKEIDVATPRTLEDPANFFLRLKDINLEDNRMSSTKERREEGYNKLLEMAKAGGFERKFKKYAAVYQNLFGYREEKKYFLVLGVAKLRKVALAKGELFTVQGRLDRKEDIFDLSIPQIHKAEKDESFDMRKARKENLEPIKMVEHVKQWPLLVDSRGKIFREIRISEDGDLIGDPISSGVTRGYAKVLHSPNEKHLEPGEILVTVTTEPSWTPVFSNASAVVMEIGGALMHGAIIAREYGIPCVGGLTGATTIIKDGDLIEVDGSSGIVKIIKDND